MEEYRITKLRQYLIQEINKLVKDEKYILSVNMLYPEANNYALIKMPNQNEVFTDILGNTVQTDYYLFCARMTNGANTLENLTNLGFFEMFERNIKSNNLKGILPDIPGIISIKCENGASVVSQETNTAEYDIQISIEYEEVIDEEL